MASFGTSIGLFWHYYRPLLALAPPCHQTHTERKREEGREREGGRGRGRQTDRQTDRQRDRETGRQREREREMERLTRIQPVK